LPKDSAVYWADSTGRSNTPGYGGVQWEDRKVGSGPERDLAEKGPCSRRT
jgi:hypothetical protein